MDLVARSKLVAFFKINDIAEGRFDFKYIGTLESRALLLLHVEVKPLFGLEIND